MPNRSNRRRRKPRQQGATQQILKRIEENTRAELDKTGPNIIDKLPMRLSAKKVYTIKRTGLNAVATVGSTNLGSSYGAMYFMLSDFDSTSEIAENYQLYRILEITVKFIPISNTVSEYTSGTAPNWGNFHSVIDYHNATTPTSIAELEQYATHQVVRTGQFVQRVLTPRVLGSIFGGVTPAYAVMPAMTWLSTDYNDAQYYGIKYATGQNVGGGTNTNYSVLCEAVIQAKSTL